MLRALFFAVSLGVLPSFAFAESFPVISANGFSCSKDGELISCRGSFPSNPTPIIESAGYNVVSILAEYPGARYTYSSDTGCLCKTDFKTSGDVQSQECTSRGGHQKVFKSRKSALGWCAKN